MLQTGLTNYRVDVVYKTETTLWEKQNWQT